MRCFIHTPLAITVLLLSLSSVDPACGCAGDCDGSGTVTIDELVGAVGMALVSRPTGDCPAIDGDANDTVTIDEVLAAISASLHGCRATPTSVPTPAPVSPTPVRLARCDISPAQHIVHLAGCTGDAADRRGSLEVSASAECCWTTTVRGEGVQVSPQRACGNATMLYELPPNRSAEFMSFDLVFIADADGFAAGVGFEVRGCGATRGPLPTRTPRPTVTASPTYDARTPSPTPSSTPACVLTLDKTYTEVSGCAASEVGRSGRVGVSTSPPSCCWSVQVTGDLAEVAPSEGCGDGEVRFSLPRNTDSSPRGVGISFSPTIPGQSVTLSVHQRRGCTPTTTRTTSRTSTPTATRTPTRTGTPTRTPFPTRPHASTATPVAGF